MKTIFTYNETCLDALREIGNIGLGNAMTALSTMIDQGVDMSVPRVGVIPLSQFAEMAGGGEAVAACIYMPVEGEISGHVAFLLPEASAYTLADHLLGLSPGTTSELDEIACSALMEIGNILTGSYLVAIGDLTGLSLLASPPALAIDMTAAILASIASTFAEDGDMALTILTRIGKIDNGIEGFFMFVPEPGSLMKLFIALGMENEAHQDASASRHKDLYCKELNRGACSDRQVDPLADQQANQSCQSISPRQTSLSAAEDMECAA